jgi:hypothetical protein
MSSRLDGAQGKACFKKKRNFHYILSVAYPCKFINQSVKFYWDYDVFCGQSFEK